MTGPEKDDLLDTVQKDWNRERPDLDTSAMAIVGRVINLAGQYKVSANRSLKSFDLQYSDFDVLATLRRSGAPYELMPSQLMESVLLTSGAMTATLSRLEKKDLILRKPRPGDARTKLVTLTESGFALIEQALETRFANARSIVSGLDKEEKEKLAQLLRKLSNSSGLERD